MSQQSGGLLLPPVQTLVATSISALQGRNANESRPLRQRITVILIQRNDGYFMPKISILKTFEQSK